MLPVFAFSLFQAVGVVECMVCPTGEDSPPLEKRSGSWLGWLPWSRASGSPKADTLGSAERGEALQGAAADGSLQDAASSTADSSATATLAGTATAPSSDHHSGPAHAEGPENTASGSGAKPRAAMLPAVGTEPPQEDGGTRDSAAAGGLGQAKHSKHLQEPRHTESGVQCIVAVFAAKCRRCQSTA
jgi:hypothetical protein